MLQWREPAYINFTGKLGIPDFHCVGAIMLCYYKIEPKNHLELIIPTCSFLIIDGYFTFNILIMSINGFTFDGRDSNELNIAFSLFS